MLYVIFIICLIVWFTLYCLICSTKCDNKDRGGFLVLYNIFFILTFSLLSAIIGNKMTKQPSALDVYRGKTELKITKTIMNDSIIEKCDTIVVFKK